MIATTSASATGFDDVGQSGAARILNGSVGGVAGSGPTDAVTFVAPAAACFGGTMYSPTLGAYAMKNVPRACTCGA